MHQWQRTIACNSVIAKCLTQLVLFRGLATWPFNRKDLEELDIPYRTYHGVCNTCGQTVSPNFKLVAFRNDSSSKFRQKSIILRKTCSFGTSLN